MDIPASTKPSLAGYYSFVRGDNIRKAACRPSPDTSSCCVIGVCSISDEGQESVLIGEVIIDLARLSERDAVECDVTLTEQ